MVEKMKLQNFVIGAGKSKPQFNGTIQKLKFNGNELIEQCRAAQDQQKSLPDGFTCSMPNRPKINTQEWINRWCSFGLFLASFRNALETLSTDILPNFVPTSSTQTNQAILKIPDHVKHCPTHYKLVVNLGGLRRVFSSSCQSWFSSWAMFWFIINDFPWFNYWMLKMLSSYSNLVLFKTGIRHIQLNIYFRLHLLVLQRCRIRRIPLRFWLEKRSSELTTKSVQIFFGKTRGNIKSRSSSGTVISRFLNNHCCLERQKKTDWYFGRGQLILLIRYWCNIYFSLLNYW